MEIRRILFPVDLTGFSSRVVPEVLFMAKKFDAQVHLLFVVGTLEEYSTFFVPHPSLDLLEMQNMTLAEQKLDEFAEQYMGDYPLIKKVVLRGHPVSEMQKYVESAEIDMIIMASHGRHGLERALFGSVADEITRNSPVPVLCINPDAEKKKWKETERFREEARLPGESGRTGAESLM